MHRSEGQFGGRLHGAVPGSGDGCFHAASSAIACRDRRRQGDPRSIIVTALSSSPSSLSPSIRPYPPNWTSTDLRQPRNAKTPAINEWLVKHRRFHMHFTRTRSSWINQVERWFGFLTDQLLRHGVPKALPHWRRRPRLDQRME